MKYLIYIFTLSLIPIITFPQELSYKSISNTEFINLICNDRMVLADSTSREQIDWKKIKRNLPNQLLNDSSFYNLIAKHDSVNNRKFIISNDIDYKCDIKFLDKTLSKINSDNVSDFWNSFEKLYPHALGTTYISLAVNYDNRAIMIVSSYQSGSAGESSLYIFKKVRSNWVIDMLILRWNA